MTSKVRQAAREHGLIKWCLCFENPIVHSAVMMRRDVVSRAGGYDVKMITSQDYDLWQRLSAMTRLANLPDGLLCLRKYEGNVSTRHAAVQFDTGFQVSQRMMSEILGQEVPLRQVRHVWRKEYDSSGDFYQVARLIYRLCRASTADSDLSRAEERAIRQDAVRRLLRLFRPRTYGVQAWIMLGWACCLAPFLSSRAVAGMVRQRLHLWMNGPGSVGTDPDVGNSPSPSSRT